jgi:SAM-dependent methyltransferase
MYLKDRLLRFVRKPAGDKWLAVIATLRSVTQWKPTRYFHFRGYAIPVALMEKTGGGPNTFEEISDGHIADLQRYIGIKKTDHVLEVGCGIGRDAIPLTKVLAQGHYIGTDIVRPSIEWCQANISRRFSNLVFVHHDIKDSLFNPSGVLLAMDIKLPAPDDSIDLIVLQSVFTHMFAEEITSYLKEFKRILKPNGRVWATFFIVDKQILDTIRDNPKTQWSLSFCYPCGEGCYINALSEPRLAVAYETTVLRKMLSNAGLCLARPLIWGLWSGKRANPGFGQDGLVLRKH